MLSILFYVTLGAAIGHGFALIASRSQERMPRLFADALVVAAFIYVAFAMASMESAWLAVEIGGLFIFVGFVLLGLKRSLSWLWLGWAIHILWDAGVHMMVEAAFVPAWYPAVCIGFDAVVAYHVYRMQANVEPVVGQPA